jgi:hypothetical protein
MFSLLQMMNHNIVASYMNNSQKVLLLLAFHNQLHMFQLLLKLLLDKYDPVLVVPTEVT